MATYIPHITNYDSLFLSLKMTNKRKIFKFYSLKYCLHYIIFQHDGSRCYSSSNILVSGETIVTEVKRISILGNKTK